MNLGEVGDSGSGARKVSVANIVDLKTNRKPRLNVVSSPFPLTFSPCCHNCNCWCKAHRGGQEAQDSLS
jgi:hypothetical protein